jgi:hypothetical protein
MHTKTHTPPNTPPPHRRSIALICALLASLLAPALAASSTAYAGQWYQVTCKNPNGSSASNQGWSAFQAGTPGTGSNNDVECSTGEPMVGELSADGTEVEGSGETLEYRPAAGSTLAGGEVDTSMWAPGSGYSEAGTTVAYSPEYAYDASNVVFQCVHGSGCTNGASEEYAGVLDLPTNHGGAFYISASCGGAGGGECSAGARQIGPFDVYSMVEVWWADMLLSNDSTPAASQVGGTLLDPDARGSSELALQATDPEGPGIYSVSVQVDGKTLYEATPDTNSGACVAAGTSNGVLMFDSSQPCKRSESVSIPVETTALTDGKHALKVSLEDAAQNTSIVYDTQITTLNAPQSTSAPVALTPDQVTVGTQLSAEPGGWSAPTGAGSITYSYQWQDCSSTGSECQAIPGASSATYTPTASDTGHTLRVQVTAADKDGQTQGTSSPTSSVLAQQGTLGAPNGPGTGSSSAGNPGVGGGSSTSSTSSTSSSTSTAGGAEVLVTGLGAANGLGASETAQLQLGVGRVILRTFAKRALGLPGRLLNSQGQPISGANLEVLARTDGSSTTKLISRAITGGDGSFTAKVPPGPSRVLEVVYRAFAGDPAYAAQAKVTENVQAGVQLHISPQRSEPEGKIKLTGQVLGPIPRHGVIVELLVHYLGHWEPFRDPRTARNGRFHLKYQFQGARGRFPFRAQVRGEQAGFPFTLGYSHTLNVLT